MAKYDSAGLAMIPSGYKASKVYSLIPNSSDGDFDFSRSGSATRVNKDGLIEVVGSNVPRLDYPFIDGVVQDTPSLLLEPSRTNLALYSEEFDNVAWIKENVTITANDLISPDGSQNADKIVENTSTSRHRVRQGYTTSAASYTYSVFAKSSNRNLVINASSAINATAGFDLSNGTIGDILVGSAKIEDFGNGWYRCSVTGTSTGVTQSIYLQSQTGYIDENYTGDGSSYISLWGAQLEQGSYATSYIPTSGSTVTRSAETCNGAGTSADFNDSEGVLFAEISALANDGTSRRISISDGNNNNKFELIYATADEVSYQLISGGSYQGGVGVSVQSLNSNKVAAKYKLNDLALWVNGFELTTDSSAVMPTGLNQLRFQTGAGGFDFYGNTKQLITFKQALTDAELEDLTSWDTFNEMATQQLYTIE